MSRRLRAFTLIELLVVIAIIGLLASVVGASLNSARTKAKIARAEADLRAIALAIVRLEDDTGQLPNHLPADTCLADPEVLLTSCAAGLVCTDGAFPGWAGPYLSSPPRDPWGQPYRFDPDYRCYGQRGCGDITDGTWLMAIHSAGPNGRYEYGGDDIVCIVCRP